MLFQNEMLDVQNHHHKISQKFLIFGRESIGKFWALVPSGIPLSPETGKIPAGYSGISGSSGMEDNKSMTRALLAGIGRDTGFYRAANTYSASMV